MKKFGFGKKGDDGGRKKSSQATQSDNPYAQQGTNDPYADSAKYANMSPYQQARASATVGQQQLPPNGQGGRPSAGYTPSDPSPASSSTYAAASPAGYSADRYGSGNGYGSDRYNNSASEARGRGGYGGFGQANNDPKDDEDDFFAGVPDRQPPGQQSPYVSNSTSYGQSDNGGDGYGGYGEQRELTAEEQEEAEYRQILAQKQQIQKESASSVSRSVQMARQANEVGQATLARLGAQGERLHNTERNLDLAANQNKVAQDRAAELKTLNRSMFAVHVGNPFTSKQRQQKADEEVMNRHRSERDQREATRREGFSANQRLESDFRDIQAAGRRRPQPRKKDYGKFNLEDEDEESNRIEDEIDAGLGELQEQVTVMNLVGRAIGKEAEAQNKQLDRIITKSDAVDDATRMNRERLARIK